MDIQFVDGDAFGIQSDSGETHVLFTSGSEAYECTCPDWQNRQPEGGCKHMIAYEMWLINSIRVGKEVIDL